MIAAFIYNLVTGELWEAAKEVVAKTEKSGSIKEDENTLGKFKS
jgi:fructose-1,6-bisphosphatase/inositol monophosphatase family enzyme